MNAFYLQKLVPAVGCAAVLGCASPGIPLPKDFPAAATAVTAQSLKDKVSGRTYSARLANGIEWEMKYSPDGRFHMRTSNGEADQGRWRTEDNRLCVDFEGKFPSGCSEVRADVQRLYLKRGSTGEVVSLGDAGSR